MRAFTIRDLERLTGVPRTTIHFYLRQGLLPRAQKTAASRSLYTDEHVETLRRIAALKEGGRTLAEIESELQALLDEINESAVDLAAHEHRRMHDRILAAATREFIANGYKNTHVSAIMRQLGITATLFYSHVPSKRRLLAECAAALVEWSASYVDARQEETGEPAERLLWHVFGQAQAFELASIALAVMRVESAEDDGETQRLMEDAVLIEVDRIQSTLDHNRERHPSPSRIPGRLVALNLFASYQPLLLPALYEAWSRRELLEAQLWLFLAVQAARNGEVDIDSRLAPYEDLLRRLGAESPPLPPGLEEPPAPQPAAD